MRALIRQPTHSPQHDSRRLVLLLLAIAFVFSQSIAQQHIHVDGEITASCLACQHSDDSPTLVSVVAVKATTVLSAARLATIASLLHAAQLKHDQLSRAPPLTK